MIPIHITTVHFTDLIGATEGNSRGRVEDAGIDTALREWKVRGTETEVAKNDAAAEDIVPPGPGGGGGGGS